MTKFLHSDGEETCTANSRSNVRALSTIRFPPLFQAKIRERQVQLCLRIQPGERIYADFSQALTLLNAMDSDADDNPVLSQHALSALEQFYSERSEQERRFEELQRNAGKGRLSMDMFGENWNVSQFWYAEATASVLARELLEDATQHTSIAIVSAPSVYVHVHNLLLDFPNLRPEVKLLEYDPRFSACEDFVFYDFNSPLDLPAELKGRFNRVLCDPPFLSEDCQTKAAMTVRWLSTSAQPTLSDFPASRLIVCTGERMGPLVPKIYPGLKTTDVEPRHAQDRLGNEFKCYANYECRSWSWR